MYLGIAVVSILSAWLLTFYVRSFQLSVPWWIDAPSVLGFFGLYLTLFDHWLWRLPLLRRLRLVQTPDLRGSWIGQGRSSHDSLASSFTATLTIRQSWLRISATMFTESSRSASTGAFLDLGGNSPQLTYHYISEPRSAAVGTMHTHRGTCRLVFASDEIEGDYYTGRDRQNFGELRFERR